MKIDGGCHCGAIIYDAEIDPEKVIICHCTDCQVLSGAPFRTVAFSNEGAFSLRSGALKTYIKTADSGTKRQMAFCPECGTHIYATSVGDDPGKIYGIRVGTIHQRESLVPKGQYWTSSAHQWLEGFADIPRSG